MFLQETRQIDTGWLPNAAPQEKDPTRGRFTFYKQIPSGVAIFLLFSPDGRRSLRLRDAQLGVFNSKATADLSMLGSTRGTLSVALRSKSY